MATKKKEGGTPVATNDAYTGMLAVSLLALIAGCVLLFLDYSQYPEKPPSQNPKAPPIVTPQAGGGQGGGGQPGGAQPGGVQPPNKAVPDEEKK